VLETLRGKHEVVDWILEHRELSKLKSTYLDALPAAVNPNTGRVHTSYSQTGAVTGRLSSSKSQPAEHPHPHCGGTARAQWIHRRAGQCAAFGGLLADRVAHRGAHGRGQNMLAAFRQGQDIHAATAGAIYSVPLEAVTKEQRRHAKAINFGLIYGMSVLV
jgi:DNA polymerase I